MMIMSQLFNQYLRRIGQHKSYHQQQGRRRVRLLNGLTYSNEPALPPLFPPTFFLSLRRKFWTEAATPASTCDQESGYPVVKRIAGPSVIGQDHLNDWQSVFLLRDNIARSERAIVEEITSISLGGPDSEVILAPPILRESQRLVRLFEVIL